MLSFDMGGTTAKISFIDDLDLVLDNLVGDGVTVSDVCGAGNGTLQWNGARNSLQFADLMRAWPPSGAEV